MWKFLETYLRKQGWYKRRLEQALELERRGEGRKDGLKMARMQHRLEVEWEARDVHPWDRHLPREARHARFIEQALVDTEAAIGRLFAALPEVDLIEICVTEPVSHARMLWGAIYRWDFRNVRPSPSVRMRLGEMGVKFGALTFEYCQLPA
jgi:hypothetical protein